MMSNSRHPMMKLSAVAVVLLMLMTTVVPVIGNGSSEGSTLESHVSSESFTYEMRYDYNTRTLTTIGKSPINLKNNDLGSWGWGKDGIGPFNSFYAAFDPSKGNNFVCLLDPYNLKKSIEGTDISGKGYNIMWVLPTIYWRSTSDASGTSVILSNDPSQGTAYAHTVDGKTHRYLAIGVYESFNPNAGFYSKSGVEGMGGSMSQYVNVSKDLMPNGTSMVWNFYQHELFKLCGLMVIGTPDSQSAIGYGGTGTQETYTSAKNSPTGLLDQIGPYGTIIETGQYAGRSSEKLFIENSVTSAWELLSGCKIVRGGLYLSQSSNISSTQFDSQIGFNEVGNVYSGWIDTINSSAAIWGLAASVSDEKKGGFSCDKANYLSGHLLIAGGCTGWGTGGGLNAYECTQYYSGINSTFQTTRLALLFDMDILNYSYTTLVPDLDDNNLLKTKIIKVITSDPKFDPSLNENDIWQFDSDGYGPFGSFYAAFDPARGNIMVTHLNPNNLQCYVGTDNTVDDIEKYNIMWVVPTLYWKVVGTSLVLTKDPNFGAEAYAHTIDGKVYEYMAIGVYEASLETINNKSILGSFTGNSVHGGQVLTDRTVKDNDNKDVLVPGYRTYVRNNTIDGRMGENSQAMILNYYQYECFRFISQAINGSMDITNGSTQKTTGLTDSSSPYAGLTGGSHKFILENICGSYYEYIDDAIAKKDNNGIGIYIGQNGSDASDGLLTDLITSVEDTNGSDKYYKKISFDSETWGLGIGGYVDSASDSESKNKVCYPKYNGVSHFLIGGTNKPAHSQGANGFGESGGSAGDRATRISFVFDKDLASFGKVTTKDGDYSWKIDTSKGIELVLEGSLESFHFQQSMPWDSNKGSIEKIEIPFNTSFEKYSFSGYGNLDTMTISSCVEIPEGLFIGTSFKKIKSEGSSDDGTLVIPQVSSIGNKAFENCTQLSEVNLPGVKNVGEYAFSGCTQLSNVYMSGISQIGQYAFSSTDIEKIGKDSTLMIDSNSIPIGCFSNCDKLTTANIPKVTSIGDNAFSGCALLSDVTVSDIGCTVGNYSFKETEKLTTITGKINSVGISSFEESGITTIDLTICTKIGQSAFKNCGNLTINNLNLTKIKTDSLSSSIFEGCSKISGSVTISNIVTELGSNIFRNCKGITSIIADGVTTIGDGAFYDCEQLGSIQLSSNGGYNVGDYAFKGCNDSVNDDGSKEHPIDFIINKSKTIGDYAFSALPIVQIVNSTIQSIGDNAFRGCESLTNVSFTFNGSNKKTIGETAFYGCIKLENVTINGITNSDKYDPELKNNVFGGCKQLEHFTSSNLKVIPDSFFMGCSSLSTVIVSQSLDYIGNSAFESCTGSLKISSPNVSSSYSIQLGDIGIIGKSAFKNCGITSASFGKITEIRESAFGDSSLSLFSADGIDIIGDYAFNNCTSLRYFLDDIDAKNVYPENNNNDDKTKWLCLLTTQQIGANAFSNTKFTDLVTLSLQPLSEKGSFSNMNELETAVIECDDKLTFLPDNTFLGCGKLENVHLADSISNLGIDVFKQTSSELSIYSNAVQLNNANGLNVISSNTVLSGEVYFKSENGAGHRMIDGSKIVIPKQDNSSRSVDASKQVYLTFNNADRKPVQLKAGYYGQVIDVHFNGISNTLNFDTKQSNSLESMTVTAIAGDGNKPWAGSSDWTITEYGQTIDLPTPNNSTLYSKIFTGTATEESFDAGTKVYMIFYESQFTLETVDQKYTITWKYHNYGGYPDKVDSDVQKGYSYLSLPDHPEVVGKTFKGWYTAPSGGTKVEAPLTVKNNATYHAQYEDCETIIELVYADETIHTFNLSGIVTIKADGDTFIAESKTNNVFNANSGYGTEHGLYFKSYYLYESDSYISTTPFKGPEEVTGKVKVFIDYSPILYTIKLSFKDVNGSSTNIPDKVTIGNDEYENGKDWRTDIPFYDIQGGVVSNSHPYPQAPMHSIIRYSIIFRITNPIVTTGNSS